MKIPQWNRRWLWVAGGCAASALLWANRRLFTVNDVTAGQTHEYPSLKPHAYAFADSQVFAIAEAAARDLPRWRVISVDRLGREIQAEAQVGILGLVDDVTIRVDPIPGSRVSEVIVRSRSRVGGGDLGENARRIRTFYRELDDRMRAASTREPAMSAVSSNPSGDAPEAAEWNSEEADRNSGEADPNSAEGDRNTDGADRGGESSDRIPEPAGEPEQPA